MIESPVLREFVAKTRRKDILIGLAERFGPVPPEIVAALETVVDDDRLDELVRWTLHCSDLNAFQQRLSL